MALKRDLGEGYTVQVSLPLSENLEKMGPPADLLQHIRTIAPQAHMSLASPHQPLYHLKSKDTVVVDRVLQLLDSETEKYSITSYDVLGTSINRVSSRADFQESYMLFCYSPAAVPSRVFSVTSDCIFFPG